MTDDRVLPRGAGIATSAWSDALDHFEIEGW
jgi:hypothetical protein